MPNDAAATLDELRAGIPASDDLISEGAQLPTGCNESTP
jgi:hypothetical protein